MSLLFLSGASFSHSHEISRSLPKILPVLSLSDLGGSCWQDLCYTPSLDTNSQLDFGQVVSPLWAHEVVFSLTEKSHLPLRCGPRAQLLHLHGLDGTQPHHSSPANQENLKVSNVQLLKVTLIRNNNNVPWHLSYKAAWVQIPAPPTVGTWTVT